LHPIHTFDKIYFMPQNGALTESKKRIISLLRQRGSLTKKELSQRSGLGWATVVKAMRELMDEKLVISKGTNLSRTHAKGKNAYVYALNPQTPLIVGIDVEHTLTTLLLTSLEGSVFLQKQLPTPQGNGERMIDFLTGCIEESLDRFHRDPKDLAGIGIGLPGLTFPTTPWRANLEKAKRVEQTLAQHFHTKVRVDTNTNAYALYARWNLPQFQERDFLFVSIRTGIGTAIFSNGNLFRGESSLSGGVGHMKVVPAGSVCHCGGKGCLETVVNQNILLRQYREKVIGLPLSPEAFSDRQLVSRELQDLFQKALDGNPAAQRILKRAGTYLGKAFVNAISLLGIEHILISGYFGEEAAPLIEPIQATVRKALLRREDIPITYVPFDPLGHTQGAVMLILSEYLSDPVR